MHFPNLFNHSGYTSTVPPPPPHWFNFGAGLDLVCKNLICNKRMRWLKNLKNYTTTRLRIAIIARVTLFGTIVLLLRISNFYVKFWCGIDDSFAVNFSLGTPLIYQNTRYIFPREWKPIPWILSPVSRQFKIEKRFLSTLHFPRKPMSIARLSSELQSRWTCNSIHKHKLWSLPQLLDKCFWDLHNSPNTFSISTLPHWW